MSRVRNTEYETVHHLTSRIAHKAYFLKEEECNGFVSLMLRVSVFSGVELLGWCVMNNHFHIYVYLPKPPALSDEEVLRRFACLKGDATRLLCDENDDRIVNPYAESGAECQTPCASSCESGAECQTPRASSDGRAEARAALVKSIRRRMYSIAEYMRMIKKWFSDDYNERCGHKGTMWAEVYGDSDPFSLPEQTSDYDDLRDRLAYIHLNPVRAAMTDRFDGYAWSSYTAYRQGVAEAVAAMHRAYPELPDEEIVAIHEQRMSRLLEEWKRKRAEEIARKREAGYSVSSDSLTDECMIAQAKERIERVQKMVIELQLERAVAKGTKEARSIACRQIAGLVSVYPDSTPRSLATTLKLPLRTVQRYLRDMIRQGAVSRGAEGFTVKAA